MSASPRSSATGAPLPLAGIRVIDFSRLLPGPWATQMLGALGAEVIKVEQPGIGDPSRHNHPRFRVDSVYFNSVNGNKRSIALDMKTAAGREVSTRLLRHADVIVESFRPGVAERLGIGYAQAKEINPRLIHCSISGFGQTGPLSHIAGHDLVIQSLTGLMEVGPDGAAPVPGLQSGDYAGGLFAVIGIQAALAQREKTGRGCELDIAMFEALYNMCMIPLSSELAKLAGFSGEPRMEAFGANPRYSTYPTKDGRHVAVSLLETRAWAEFCRHIGRPELVSEDESPEDRLSTHGERSGDYRAALETWCAAHTLEEITRDMDTAGIAICAVARPEDAVRLPHVTERGALDYIDHPIEGRIPQLTNPLWRAGLARRQSAPAPALGGATRAILAELGYAAAEIDALVASGTAVPAQETTP
jgi:CoA:oxalate CoA-transferase